MSLPLTWMRLVQLQQQEYKNLERRNNKIAGDIGRTRVPLTSKSIEQLQKQLKHCESEDSDSSGIELRFGPRLQRPKHTNTNSDSTKTICPSPKPNAINSDFTSVPRTRLPPKFDSIALKPPPSIPYTSTCPSPNPIGIVASRLKSSSIETEVLDEFNEKSVWKLEGKLVVRVGTGETQKSFHIERSVLWRALNYSDASLPKPHALLSSSPLDQFEDIELPFEPPIAFDMFTDWAKTPKRPILYGPGQYSEEPWLSHAAAAYFLGDYLDAAEFSMYALSQFTQNCAIATRGPWRLIEERSSDQSPLLKFSNHWVAWNYSLSGFGVNEYTGLKASKLATQVVSSTRDPRTYDLKHWYSDCGSNINAQCDHDPIFRKNECVKETLKQRPPPPVWGAEEEAAANAAFGTRSPQNREIPLFAPRPLRRPRTPVQRYP